LHSEREVQAGKHASTPRFKALLERAGQLEAWLDYEQNAIEEALRAWSEEHGLALTCVRKDAGG
jgi:hypothetical protein